MLVRFAVLSLVLVIGLGAVLTTRVQHIIEQRNITAAGANVALAVDIVTRSQAANAQANAGGKVTPRQVVSLTVLFKSLEVSAHIVGVEVYLPNGLIEFSDDLKSMGQRRPVTEDMRAALAGHYRSSVTPTDPGRVSAHVATLEKRYGKLLTIIVPARPPGSAKPVAAVEAYLSYAPIARAIRSDVRSTVVLLIAGLAVLYLALFRLVAGASRKLRRQADANHELATHDNLTGLPNRTLLRDRVDQAVRASRRTGSHVVLMLLDLDRFKEVNDTLGHHHGDRLLQQVGPRLQSVLREADTVARLGGDEFVVLVPNAATPEDAVAIGVKLIDVLQEPFMLDDVTLDVDTSVGIAFTPDHGDTFDDLLQRADIAMYVAKESHTGVSVYSAEFDAHSPSRLALLGELRRAIEDPEQLVCYYQPKADAVTRRTVGVEALARWHHPVHGVIPPADFIPAAERTGLIKPLTTRVLTIALAQVRDWAAQGINLPVAVNISARCLLDLEFPTEVAQLLEHFELAPMSLELELTESTIMSDPARALEVLTALHDLGVYLSIDDFGTGYSSMAYLKRLPVHELKIDRAFVTDMADEDGDAAIVRSTLELARNLDLRVVAEGVETEQVWEHLERMGCDVVQGFYLSRPLPADQLLAWLLPASRDPVA